MASRAGKSSAAVTSVRPCETANRSLGVRGSALRPATRWLLCGRMVGILQPTLTSQTQRHIACGTGRTNTKEITTDGEVGRVSSCEAATHIDTVAYNRSALTKRYCNIFWAEDKRWKHLIDATFDKEPEEQIVLKKKCHSARLLKSL